MHTKIYKEFTFEAAHSLSKGLNIKEKYKNLHGHSFKVQIYISGNVNPNTGLIEDFSKVDKIIKPIKETLDHNYLNQIDGLENPTLENISHWVWNKLKNDIKGLNKIKIKRGSCGEGCEIAIY